jgi:soluble lytic murein transglycosylase-like protein
MRFKIRFPLFALFILPAALMAAHEPPKTTVSGGTETQSVTTAATEPKALPAPPDKQRPSRKKLKPLIDRTAKRYGVERELVHAVVAAESAYDAHAVSHAGAIGLMQVMPQTAADYGVTDASALFDPKINVNTGTRHLRRLLGKYKNDYGRVIMAYNAGEGTVDRTNSNVTYAETLNYTAAVIRNYRRNGGKHPTEAAMRKVAALKKISNTGKGRRLLKKYLDPSLLSLSVRTTLPVRYLNPGLHRAGPSSRPMIVLESPKKKKND